MTTNKTNNSEANVTNVINAAKATLKNVQKELTSGNKEFHSISSVLKFMQQKQYMKYYESVFVACGVTDKITPAQFFAVATASQWGQSYNKKGEPVGEKWVGIWGVEQVKDAEGNKLFEEDGKTPKVAPKLRKVTAWTPNKVFKVLSQAQAFKTTEA